MYGFNFRGVVSKIITSIGNTSCRCYAACRIHVHVVGVATRRQVGSVGNEYVPTNTVNVLLRLNANKRGGGGTSSVVGDTSTSPPPLFSFQVRPLLSRVSMVYCFSAVGRLSQSATTRQRRRRRRCHRSELARVSSARNDTGLQLCPEYNTSAAA